MAIRVIFCPLSTFGLEGVIAPAVKVVPAAPAQDTSDEILRIEIISRNGYRMKVEPLHVYLGLTNSLPRVTSKPV